MRLSRHDEVIAIYDRILRLLSSIEITLNSAQRADLVQMLNEAAAAEPEEPSSLGLRCIVNVIRAYDGETT